MGFSSSKLTCPKGYDEEKFKVMLQLFRFLDLDGDRVLDDKDVEKFTNAYYECELEDIKKEIKTIKHEEKNTLLIRDENANFAVEDFEKTCLRNNNKNTLTKKQKERKFDLILQNKKLENKIIMDNNNKISELETKAMLYKEFSHSEKVEHLRRLIQKNPKKPIEFKKFFKHLKDRNVTKIGEIVL